MNQAIFGIIGAGGIAQTQHLPNMTQAPHIRLKTVCDLREDVLKETQQKYNVPHTETDYRKLLDDPEIDAVVVATKEDMQAKLSIEALKAGKHVYAEKPLAESTEDFDAVIAAQKESGKKACVGFNRRMAPAYRKAKEILCSDGGPKNIYYRISDEYWDWGRRFPPGVRVIHEVCHIFDVLRWFTDSDPVSIYCIDSRSNDEILTMKFKSGCVASIMNSGYVTMDLPKERVEIVSQLGAVIVEEFVECRTYGFADYDHIYRFAGRRHPDNDGLHKYLLKQDGANALHALRRMGWETRERAKGTWDEDELAEKTELERIVDRYPIWNYIMDKGWLGAVDHLAECILQGKSPEIASAKDAWWAWRMAYAAISSRESGEIVKF